MGLVDGARAVITRRAVAPRRVGKPVTVGDAAVGQQLDLAA
jgi:hypothetical protein